MVHFKGADVSADRFTTKDITDFARRVRDHDMEGDAADFPNGVCSTILQQRH